MTRSECNDHVKTLRRVGVDCKAWQQKFPGGHTKIADAWHVVIFQLGKEPRYLVYDSQVENYLRAAIAENDKDAEIYGLGTFGF